MSYKQTSIIQGSIGTRSITFPFVPAGLRFTISQKDPGPVSDMCQYSTGTTDGVNHFAHSILSAPNINITRRSEVYSFTHYAMVNNLTTRVISATALPWTTPTVDLNFDRADINYEITVEAFA